MSDSEWLDLSSDLGDDWDTTTVGPPLNPRNFSRLARILMAELPLVDSDGVRALPFTPSTFEAAATPVVEAIGRAAGRRERELREEMREEFQREIKAAVAKARRAIRAEVRAEINKATDSTNSNVVSLKELRRA
jgi:hypothetical protein